MIQNVVLLFTIASCVLSSFSVCAGKAIKKPLSPEFISQIPGIYPPPDIKDVKVLLDAQAGISAIVQPGGSIRDQEVIDEADARGIAMLFTGHRLFRH